MSTPKHNCSTPDEYCKKCHEDKAGCPCCDCNHVRQTVLMIKGNWVPLADCEFMGVEENIYGHDQYTVNYKGKQYTCTGYLR